MTPERWHRVEELFYGALDRGLDRDPGALDAYLSAACGTDENLRREVESLLEAGDASGRIGGVVARGARLTDLEEAVPERLGPYRVLREIGRGGLRTVYLAERDDEHYSMQVAIKWVRRGLDTDDILARLRQERQILAHLDHPNITRLLDGGSTENGRPYLVMEYVDGTTLDIFCDQRRLGVRPRLRLVLEICGAVAEAHRNLVIHRDIKPSNVLVTEDGAVKLLDFGIAKLLDHDSETEPTAPAQRLLTPEYASPEQLQGLPLSTATDIYSLGALLHRLLTGHAPSTPGGSTTPEAAPRRPSDRLVLSREEATVALAAQRGTTPVRLRQELRGDLDNILLKALATGPRERYGSVSEFADDLQRHLEDLPVRARPPRLTVLWWKFIRRNRWASLAGALAAVSLVVGLSATSWQAQRARRAQAEAERVSAFLEELLEASKPEVSRGEPVEVRSILDRGAERIATDLVDEPEVQTRLMTTMGQAYLSLGLYEQAADLHREALRIRRARHGDDHLEVAVSAHALAETLVDTGELVEAEHWFTQALAIRRAQLEVRDLDIAETLNGLGTVYRRSRRLDEAKKTLGETLKMYRHLRGEDHTDTAAILNNLGLVHLNEGLFEEAEALLRQATEIRRRHLDPGHPDLLISLSNLARALRRLDKLAEAEMLLRSVLVEGRTTFGEEHRVIAATLNSLAKTLADQGKLEEAAVDYRQAMNAYAGALGATNPIVARAATNLGELLLQTERTEEAEQILRQSLEIHRHHPEHAELARTLEALGGLLCDADRPATAEPMLREAVEIRRQVHMPGSSNHWRIAAAEGRLGACLLAQGRTAEATPLLRTAHGGLLRYLGPHHPRTRDAAKFLDPPLRIEDAAPPVLPNLPLRPHNLCRDCNQS